jgi:hypothetical protein
MRRLGTTHFAFGSRIWFDVSVTRQLQSMESEASSPLECALIARHGLVFGRSFGDRTMMQSFASAASSGAAGPLYTAAREPWFLVGSPPPRMSSAEPLHGTPAKSVVLLSDPFPFAVIGYDAGRRTMPSDSSPVVTRRQSAMSSLRANATIIVLRVPARPSTVRV